MFCIRYLHYINTLLLYYLNVLCSWPPSDVWAFLHLVSQGVSFWRFIIIICILLKQITLEDKRRNQYYNFRLLAHICRGSGWSSVFRSLTSDHKPNTTNVGSCPDKRTCVSQNRSTQRSGLEITGRVSWYLNPCCKNKIKNKTYHCWKQFQRSIENRR